MTLLTLSPVRPERDPNAPTTPDDLLDLEERGLYELVDGELVEKPMSYLSNLVAGRVGLRLGLHCEGSNAGHVLPEQSFRCFPDDPDLVRRPDLAVVVTARVPNPFPPGHVRFAPDLAVEVVSPTNTVVDLDEKLDDYRSAGVRMVWVISPEARVVRVHQPGQPIVEVRGDEVLRGDPVLPGFAVAVREFWPAAVADAGGQ